MESGAGGFEALRDLFGLYWVIRQDRPGGLRVLDEWLARHPNDEAIREARRYYADSLKARP